MSSPTTLPALVAVLSPAAQSSDDRSLMGARGCLAREKRASLTSAATKAEAETNQGHSR